MNNFKHCKTEIDAKAACLEHLKRMYAEFFVQIGKILGGYNENKNIKSDSTRSR